MIQVITHLSVQLQQNVAQNGRRCARLWHFHWRCTRPETRGVSMATSPQGSNRVQDDLTCSMQRAPWWHHHAVAWPSAPGRRQRSGSGSRRYGDAARRQHSPGQSDETRRAGRRPSALPPAGRSQKSSQGQRSGWGHRQKQHGCSQLIPGKRHQAHHFLVLHASAAGNQSEEAASQRIIAVKHLDDQLTWNHRGRVWPFDPWRPESDYFLDP